MFQVIKRDGEIADFQMAKISSAINKAFEAKEKELQSGYDRSSGFKSDCRFSG